MVSEYLCLVDCFWSLSDATNPLNPRFTLPPFTSEVHAVTGATACVGVIA